MLTGAENSDPEFAALQNAANALATVNIDDYGYWRGGLKPYRRDRKRELKKPLDDYPEHTVEPLHLSKECLQEGNVKEPTARSVLKTISSKAGFGKPKEISNNIPKPAGSSAKGKITTQRHQVIEIYRVEDLVSIAEVVIDAIKLFSDKSRSADQKAWCVGKKRKRT